MTKYRVKNPKSRPVDTRDRLPSGSNKVLVYLKGGKGHWVELTPHDVRNLHRFSTGPIYWSPLVSS